ncbi:MAG: cation diffusion facilitator family transporter [Cyanobacteria bacterium]|nr:cation diffusion facilitator family transporter [Cyanobacteriota bacterium]
MAPISFLSPRKKRDCYRCHLVSNSDKLQGLVLVMVSVLLFAGVEFGVSLHSHSLSLGADSGHMLSDGISLGIALCATWLARRSSRLNAGGKLETMAALVNGLGLLAMAMWISREAWTHFQGPPIEVLSLPMMATASLGLLINGFNFYWLQGSDHQNLNMRGISLHIVADTLGSIGAILAAVAVFCWQWTWADTVIGFVVAVIVSIGALSLIGQCLRQLWGKPVKEPQLPQDLAQLGWLETGKTDLSRQIL